MSIPQRMNRKILALFGRGAKPAPEPLDESLRRSTSPDAKMTLILRFETKNGPRSVIAAAIPLSVASDIADEMFAAGHFAEFVDHLAPLSLAERMERQRAEAAPGKILALTAGAKPGAAHSRQGAAA